MDKIIKTILDIIDTLNGPDIIGDIEKAGKIAKIIVKFAEEIAKNPITWITIILIVAFIYNNFIKK